MINEQARKDIAKFLLDYPNPAIVTATSMKDGFVQCLNGVPTIFGPTMMCNPGSVDELSKLINR